MLVGNSGRLLEVLEALLCADSLILLTLLRVESALVV